jgi:large subunit ribosomal protein L15e
MGAYKYLEEMWRHKQSDVMRFLLRVRAWEYRQGKKIQRVSRPTRTEKAHKLGYKAKQGFCVYRVGVRRGGRKRPNHKGIVHGKPKHAGINHMTSNLSLRRIAEMKVGRALGSLRLLNSYWINQDATYKYFEVIMVDPSHLVIRNDPRINWICGATHKHREMRGVTSAGKANRGMRVKGHRANNTIGGSRKAAWKSRNTQVFRRYR